MGMDKSTLKQYLALKHEVAKLDKSIEKLQRKLDDLPAVMGKVQASMNEFPYNRTYIPVEMGLPSEADALRKRIRIREIRRKSAMKTLNRIEQYIKSISNSTDRQIFEMVFIDGLTYRDVGDQLHMDYSNVAKRIDRQLASV